MQQGKNQYSPIPGAAVLRKAIVQKLSIDITIDNVAITTGTQEVYSL